MLPPSNVLSAVPPPELAMVSDLPRSTVAPLIIPIVLLLELDDASPGETANRVVTHFGLAQNLHGNGSMRSERHHALTQRLTRSCTARTWWLRRAKTK